MKIPRGGGEAADLAHAMNTMAENLHSVVSRIGSASEVLTAIDNNQAPNLRGFFNRVRRLTLEGMFGDPVYGGNKNFAGWDLIRYPGAKLAVGPEDQSMKTPPKPFRKGLYGAGENHGH